MFNRVPFKTGPADTGGTSDPQIDTQNFGAVAMYSTSPSGQEMYHLLFSVKVSDADSVPANIKSVTIEGPGITGSLPMVFVDDSIDFSTTNYWRMLPYGSYEDIPEGLYTFRVEDEDGNVAEARDYLLKKQVPFAGNLKPNNGASINRPVISWDKPVGKGTYFYKLKIRERWYEDIHSSDILPNTAYVVPDGIFKAGQLYHYKVYVFDKDIRTWDVDNMSVQGIASTNTNRFFFTDTPRVPDLSDVFKTLKIMTREQEDIISLDADVNKNNKMDSQDAISIIKEKGNTP
jgi:hypothetical protein